MYTYYYIQHNNINVLDIPLMFTEYINNFLKFYSEHSQVPVMILPANLPYNYFSLSDFLILELC